eukprot:432419_1
MAMLVHRTYAEVNHIQIQVTEASSDTYKITLRWDGQFIQFLTVFDTIASINYYPGSYDYPATIPNVISCSDSSTVAREIYFENVDQGADRLEITKILIDVGRSGEYFYYPDFCRSGYFDGISKNSVCKSSSLRNGYPAFCIAESGCAARISSGYSAQTWPYCSVSFYGSGNEGLIHTTNENRFPPSGCPSPRPTSEPTQQTIMPSTAPSAYPTDNTLLPTNAPTQDTLTPTQDTLMPTTAPSVYPTQDTLMPTTFPTTLETVIDTSYATEQNDTSYLSSTLMRSNSAHNNIYFNGMFVCVLSMFIALLL